MSVRRVFLAVLSVWMAVAVRAAADGFVIVPPTPELPDPEQLAVAYHHVDIAIRDQVAAVHIDQAFRNLNRREVEGEYIFPIPEGAAVSDFVLFVDGRAVHAEAMDAGEALRVYQDLVRRGRDPALLEYAGREMFRARIYPFAPGGERQVQLEYDHLVERQGGLYRFVYPLSTEKFSSRPLENAYVRIELEADQPIRNAYCPSHDVEIEYLGARRLRVTWEESGTKPDRDLVLYYSLAEGAMDIRIVPYRPDSGEDGYFMLLAASGDDDRLPVSTKDIVFVIDHSGSMNGEKMEEAREALIYCLEHLNPGDRFDIVTFASSVDEYAGELREATPREVREAVDHVRALEAGGGTNISEALEHALDRRFSSRRPAFVVFLTDGLPTAGETDVTRILERVARDAERARGHEARRGRVRIFPFGVGYDVNAVFLDELADENAGVPQYVRPAEDLREVVAGFYARVAHPVLSDLELDLDGVRLRDLEPGTLPDLFRGGQLVLFGRYRGSGSAELTLSGRSQGEPRAFTSAFDFPAREGRNAFVARLWATRRVGSLLRRVRLHGEEPELVEEIKSLGLRFGIATPYTSFLVDERGPYLAEESARDYARMPDMATAPSGMAFDATQTTGRAAFELSKKTAELAAVASEAKLEASAQVRVVGARAFRLGDGVWKQTDMPQDVRPTEIEVGSAAYFALLAAHPELGAVLALGERVLFEAGGRWYRTVPAKESSR